MSSIRKIRKAVFPVAGLGTRFLPATKSIPKEMLTVVDKPVIQYVVDEAREAGIEHLIFVTGRNKAVIEDYFDAQVELYSTLAERGKKAELEHLQELQPQPAPPASPASRFHSALAMRSGAHANWSAMSLLHCFCQIWSCSRRRVASRKWSSFMSRPAAM